MHAGERPLLGQTDLLPRLAHQLFSSVGSVHDSMSSCLAVVLAAFVPIHQTTPMFFSLCVNVGDPI